MTNETEAIIAELNRAVEASRRARGFGESRSCGICDATVERGPTVYHGWEDSTGHADSSHPYPHDHEPA